MNAYEFLGLEPGTTDEGAIRKAYAAALKAHRPDVDPAGFADVRSAYQWVMARRAATVESEEPDSEEPDSGRDDAADEGTRDEDGEETDIRQQGPDAVRGGKGNPEAVRRPEPTRERSPVSDELDELEERIRSVLEDPASEPTSALAVARRLLRTPAALCEARFSGPGVALAARVALDDPALAERLGAAIYEVASPRERATLPFDEVDRRRRFGALCAGAAAPTSRVVRAILEGRDPAEIGDADDVAAFERDMHSRVAGDPLLEWVLKNTPELPYTQRRLSRRPSGAKTKTEQAVTERRRAPVKKRSGGAGMIYVLLIAVAGAVRTCNRSPTPPPYPYGPPISDYLDNQMPNRYRLNPLDREGDTSPRRAVPPETSVPEDPFRAAYDQVNAIRVRAGLPPVPYPPGIGPKAGGDAGTSK